MGLVDLLLPAACAACGRYGAPLCESCLGGFRAASRPEDRFLAPDPGVVVGEAFEVAIAAYAHDGAVRRVLARLKYGGARRLAAPLAERAAGAFASLVALSGPGTVVPVPVHPARQRERGYNQAALLAAVLAGRAGLPLREALHRRRETTRQHGLGRAARLRNLEGAFAAMSGRAPPVAIVVDDILTTSATLEACALALRACGTERVYGFAVAREI